MFHRANTGLMCSDFATIFVPLKKFMNCIREGCCGKFTASLEGQNPVLCGCWNFFKKFLPTLIQLYANCQARPAVYLKIILCLKSIRLRLNINKFLILATEFQKTLQICCHVHHLPHISYLPRVYHHSLVSILLSCALRVLRRIWW